METQYLIVQVSLTKSKWQTPQRGGGGKGKSKSSKVVDF